MKLEIRICRSKKWYWRIKASNGRVICHSETYSSRSKAWKTIESVIRWAKSQ